MRRPPERQVCAGCRRVLPIGVEESECAFCELLRRSLHDGACACIRPVRSRLYLGRWQCRLCGGLN